MCAWGGKGLGLGRGLGVRRSCRGNGRLCWGWALGVLGARGTGYQVVLVCGVQVVVQGIGCTGCAEHQVCQVLRVLGTGCVWLLGVLGSTCAKLWVANVPHRVSIVSEAGQGTLTIRDVKEADQGAYTCEAINTLGMVFGIPDSILTVTRPGKRPLLPPCHQSYCGTVTITSCVISHRAVS